ncbi:MAG: monofunctional biosynthetic peptidoglycan transglycosylase [Pseudomonadota bacterium]
MAEAGSRGRGRIKRALWIALKFFGGLFVSLHVYALILFFAPVPGTANMAIRALQGEAIKRDWESIERISPHLIRAVIAAEDSRFCEHIGIDFEALDRALDERASGRVRGASTITQQTAKNVFFWNGGGLPRKAGEAWMALFIDQFWGKKRVMEVYLNVAEWGDGIFGAEAAAQARFGKSAADLTEREAALMAAVLPSPNRYRLDPPGPYVRRQAGTYQARMRVVDGEGLADCVLGERD